MTGPEREVAEPVIPSKGYELVIGPYPTDPDIRDLWREEASDA